MNSFWMELKDVNSIGEIVIASDLYVEELLVLKNYENWT